jgi:biopolymer transport protein TolR
MSIATGGNAALTNDINVTPMIDVLLVLLIVFMMAVPMMRKAIDVQLPDPAQNSAIVEKGAQIVLQVLPGGAYKINSESVTKEMLGARLKEIFGPRPLKIIYVKGDPAVKFQQVFFGMDQARAAGVKVIGIPPK